MLNSTAVDVPLMRSVVLGFLVKLKCPALELSHDRKTNIFPLLR